MRLEPLVQGYPAWRGFVLPLFRSIVRGPESVVHAALVTSRERLALLLYSFSDREEEIVVRSLHVPPGELDLELYDAAKLASPLRKERVRLEGRMSPIRIRVPPRLEALAVLSP